LGFMSFVFVDSHRGGSGMAEGGLLNVRRPDLPVR